ncbi:FAS1 domain-containing protein [Trichophaea hybrida]|nr:FAS1 domain-containing protein [Trichophaea hybrida]
MPPKDHTGPHTNSTMWDLISKSKHTKRFYELLKDDKDIMDILQNKNANHTVFAPSNKAFEMLDKFKKHHDVPKDLIHRVLMYHIAPGCHRSQDLWYHNTLITSLPDDELGQDMHQRVRIGMNHKGPSINFYSQFTMFDIYANNGIIHGIDALLLPPPEILDLIKLLPSEFSTTEVALSRTGLLDELPKLRGKGLTVFAPSNQGWKKLGYKINAFLFSDCDKGNVYLRALMKYHIVPDDSLYSDALVSPEEGNDGFEARNELDDPSGLNHGYSHVDLQTLLKDKHVSVDITRLGRFLSFRVNGLTSIVISDGIAKSGVIQVPDHILIPPHSLHDHYDPPKGLDVNEEEEEEGIEAGVYSLDEFKRILEPFVEREQRELEELGRLGILPNYEL